MMNFNMQPTEGHGISIQFQPGMFPFGPQPGQYPGPYPGPNSGYYPGPYPGDMYSDSLDRYRI